ncbi:MAG: cation:proton antiporter [Deltaproteobacteria bacterium]|nr:cation:proton antiporter [Deltaproteobacteria bacterium]
MDDQLISLVLWALIFVASFFSVELGLSVAIIEISLGVIGGNFLGLHPTPWISYLAGFGGILLTFLAGAEVDTQVMKAKLKESFLIGAVSFLFPFLGAMVYAHYLLDWSWPASKIAGIALSTTSLAVVYAVLVETGLTNTELGKILMAATFFTDLGTAMALSLLFLEFNWFTLLFLGVSIVLILVIPRIYPWICRRYGDRVIEPEIKFLFLVLVVIMFFAKVGASHAILPAFVLGLAMSNSFMENRKLQRRLRVVAFAIITPFFFINGGMNISLKLLLVNSGLLVQMLLVKQVTKIAGVYPLAKKYLPENAMYTTLLMSTGLTMGTISSVFGLTAGLISQAQFSVLVATVVLSAIIPTFIAQKWFEPAYELPEMNGLSTNSENLEE